MEAAVVETAPVVLSGHATRLARHRRQMVGIVVSTKNNKTAVVAVTRTFLHPKVRKYVRRMKKYMAHDEHGEAHEGDQVLIEECRPISKRKNWRLRTVMRRKA